MESVKRLVSAYRKKPPVRLKDDEATRYKLTPEGVETYCEIRKEVFEKFRNWKVEAVKKDGIANHLLLTDGGDIPIFEYSTDAVGKEWYTEDWLAEEIKKRFKEKVPDYEFAPGFHEWCRLSAGWSYLPGGGCQWGISMKKFPEDGGQIYWRETIVAEIEAYKLEGTKISAKELEDVRKKRIEEMELADVGETQTVLIDLEPGSTSVMTAPSMTNTVPTISQDITEDLKTLDQGPFSTGNTLSTHSPKGVPQLLV